MVAAAVPLLVSASESPDRECCDGPSYKLEPGAGRGQEASFPRYNYPPPEVPDFLAAVHAEALGPADNKEEDVVV